MSEQNDEARTDGEQETGAKGGEPISPVTPEPGLKTDDEPAGNDGEGTTEPPPADEPKE